MEVKKTGLYQNHLRLNGNLVEFAGYLMPLYYSSISKEHHAVRTDAGIFDISHMGEIHLYGKDALKFINYASTNLVLNDKDQMTYSLLVDKEGHTIDDLMSYVNSEDDILLVVNASNATKDFNHLLTLAKDYDVSILNESNLFSAFAIQGPKAQHYLEKYLTNLPKKSLSFIHSTIDGKLIYISRSGYTGEDGFEVFGDNDVICSLWDKLINDGVTPCGLGARDTLRFEAAMPLYGHEISEDISPVEAGLSFGYNLDKENFVGKDALVKIKEHQTKKIVGLELLERNIPREGYQVYYNDLLIGHVTTGYLSPTLNKPIALALINLEYAKIGLQIFVKIREKMIPAIIRNKKFYQKKNVIKGE